MYRSIYLYDTSANYINKTTILFCISFIYRNNENNEYLKGYYIKEG